MTPRRLLTCIAAAATAAGLVTTSATAAGPAAHAAAKRRPAPPARMLVYAQEWSLWPSRATVPSGTVVVQLWNRGMDAHDLRIRRLRGRAMTGRAQGVAVTQSGALHQATWHLGPGRYEMYCSLPGHAMRGMRVQITVKRP